jgi:hypothetical protein
MKALLLILMLVSATGCIRYSFSGAAIPDNVNTIYIPFFQDQSGSGLADLSDRLSEALINRFVNQTRLRITNNAEEADIVMEGVITGYRNVPFSIGGNEQASLNRVTVTVRASFKYKTEPRPAWNKSFTGNGDFDPSANPIEGETTAAGVAMDQIAQSMFNDSVGRW